MAICITDVGKNILKYTKISNCPIAATKAPFFMPNCSILDVRKNVIILTGIEMTFCIVLLVSLENPALTN